MQETKLENKIIFLDVDGVLNSDKTKARTPNGYIGISSEKVDMLKKIVKDTGASIILSSSWRLMEPIDLDYKYLIHQLEYKGLHIQAKTELLKNHRGKEIKKYLDEHKEIEAFVILDDEFIQEFEECNLSKHLVHTDFTNGLTKDGVEKAIKILNNEFDYIPCEFSIDELLLIQGALHLCKEKQLFTLEETYLKSMDLYNKVKLIISRNKDDGINDDENNNHFGRPLES